MENWLPIEDEYKKLALYYLKANHYLIKTGKNSWTETFNAELSTSEKRLYFKTNKDKTLFLLRWG